MNVTEIRTSDLKPPVRDGESNIDTPSDDTIISKVVIVQSANKALRQMIVSLEQQLDTEKQLRIKAQADFKNVVKQWKLAAQELSKQQTDAKTFHTVTDDYLKQLAEGLRYDVRCFSEAYFEDLPTQSWPQPLSREDGYRPASVLPEQYAQCPASPALAQSFIWRLLKQEVFEHYEWPADEQVGAELYNISKFLNPKGRNSPNETEISSDYEVLKKFHIWRATTANMVFSVDASVNPQDRWRKFKTRLVRNYIDPVVLSLIPESEYGRYHGLLNDIIEKALIMDREISRQAAWVRWVFEDLDNLLETVAGNTIPINEEMLRVIVTPAMIKRGKSSGDGFEEQIELLQAETCVIQIPLQLSTHNRERDV